MRPLDLISPERSLVLGNQWVLLLWGWCMDLTTKPVIKKKKESKFLIVTFVQISKLWVDESEAKITQIISNNYTLTVK